ncbi:site-2 protease family protein [Streptomyces alfalfae]|uniref:Site-2 protease family protein n=1 Tax=Streptomyces alfalfae TaxID=1642299 RepID=A0A7T4PDW7_9ACTN|nr:site-2 protease family protein [Streptomyces alfalfae]QQC88431.1 site-2 protease family protein [Streptomyces alfalfae]
MDERGESGRPQSDGAGGPHPSDTAGSAESPRPLDVAEEPTRPPRGAADAPPAADRQPEPRSATPLTKTPRAQGPAGDATPERSTTEREAADRDATEPPAEPAATEPAAPEPGATETGATEPAAPAPGAAEPPAAMPAAAGPRAAQPAAPEPGVTEAGGTEPGATEARPAGRPQAPGGSGPTGTRPPAPGARGRRTGPPKAQKKGPGGGLLMGRPFGVPVYVAPSWFLVAALITWVFGGQLDRVLPELGGARYLVSLFFAVAFYASVLVHELAHTVAALRFKLPVRRIQLQFFGGVSEIEKESETPGREFVLAFVGPLLSLVLAGVFYAGMRAVEPGTVPGVLLAGLMISNLIVAVFNLLPGLPLDGGRMLRAVVWKITGKPMSGTIAAAWVGRALAVSVLIGLPLLNQSGALGGDPQEIGGMNTVTDALLAAILAAIIWTGAGNSLRMARLREHLPELRARTLTRRAVPVESGTPLSEALRRANDAGARALVVVDPDGDPTAVVREAAIVSVPQHRRPWVTVSGLAQDLTEGMRVSAELAGEELLDTLRATPATEYLVVEDSGEIYGVLSAADVERAFVKAMARPS